MFHFDGGLKLTAIDLAIDVTRRQPRGFISHAHGDHMARHELTFCTPETARLCEHRMGPLRIKPLHFNQPITWADAQLTAIPAGHVLGSAMLLAELDGQRLLYTGDFRLTPEAYPTEVDYLVMETTFGDPRFRFPPREQVADELVELVKSVIQRGGTPVIYTYLLGKAQEVTRVLTEAGLIVLQHPRMAAISKVYEECGQSLGDFRAYEGRPIPGCPILLPPPGHRRGGLSGLTRVTTIAVTGWCLDPAKRRRMHVDHALPFSDHADYDELLGLIERVAPKEVYCTHGPHNFAEQLREMGHEAQELEAISCR